MGRTEPSGLTHIFERGKDMQKLFRYGSVQDGLNEYYKAYGKCAAIGDVICQLEREQFDYLQDGEKLPCPDFMAWDMKNLQSLVEINRQVVINALIIQRNRKKPVDGVREENAFITVMPFLHYALHKPELRKKDVLELGYVLRGSGRYFERDREIKLKEGDLLLIGCGQIHDISADPNGIIFGLQIDMKMIEHDFQRFLTGNHLLSFLFRKCLYDKTDNLYILHVKGTEAINRLISHILDEYNRMEAYSTNSCICYTEFSGTWKMRMFLRVLWTEGQKESHRLF